MNELDTLYGRFLSLGFIVMRQAMQSGNREWAEAEIEMLHNVPSLLGEENKERHRYFWYTERQHYIDWISSFGPDEAKSRMRTYYFPIWREMEPLVEELVTVSSADAS